MAARPYIVNATIPYNTFTYDGVPNNVILRGTIIDVPASSALATALGSYITSLTGNIQLQPGASDSLGPAALGNMGGNGSFGGTGTSTGAGSGAPFAWPQ